MTADIVNLRRVRKAKARMKDDARAATNSAHHGTPKALRDNAKGEKARAERTIEAHRLDDPT